MADIRGYFSFDKVTIKAVQELVTKATLEYTSKYGLKYGHIPSVV